MTRQLSERQRSLIETTKRYHEALDDSPGAKYLDTRGLLTNETVAEQVRKFRFGFVGDPAPGHERYQGMLAIPYLRQGPRDNWSVVSIRFRCIRDGCLHEGHGKYMTMAGDTPRLFNTYAIANEHNVIGIAEGEIDAVTATVAGLPTVGIAGAKVWKDHFTTLFLGYEKVYIFADGDSAGRDFADTLYGKLDNARIVPMSTGEDVNSTLVKHGPAHLLERLTP